MKIQNTITKKVYDINTTLLGDIMESDTSLYDCPIDGIDYQTADQGAIDWWLEYAPRYQDCDGSGDGSGYGSGDGYCDGSGDGSGYGELNGVIEAFLDNKGIEN